MTSKIYNVLILCTGNSVRSILSEVLLNAEGKGRFHAFSAGSQPRGEVHPQTLITLKAMGHDVSGLGSKSWDVFSGPEAPVMDIIITVCDSASGEVCPVWPGHPLSVHWGFDDPGHASPDQQPQAFLNTYRLIQNRMRALAALDIDQLSVAELRSVLNRLAAGDGATPLAISLAAEVRYP